MLNQIIDRNANHLYTNSLNYKEYSQLNLPETGEAVLKFWKEKNIKLGVYSSGSVAAQKLLFAHTTFGDLTPHFSNYFDTTIGAKREVESYKKIQETLNLNAEEILFLSDIEQELDAAQSAGFQTIQLVRKGTVPSTKHKTAKNFKELLDLSY